MIPYQPEAWHDLFVAAGGAAAALDGLLVVAASINVKEILASPGLPRLAARALGLLLSLLLMSLFVLAPGQSPVALGIEIGALGVVLTAAMTYSVIRSHFPVQQWKWTGPTLGLALLASLPMIGCGISLIAGAGGGLFWALGELIVGFSCAIYYAWILLIEILR